MEDLLQLQLLARQQRTPYAVATIVEATGSTPRTEGKMLVYADGRSAGTIGGGLAELRAKKDAADAIRCGKNRLVRYEVVPQAAASGMACGGALQVFIEVYGTRPLLVVCGGGHVGTCVLRAAKLTGFELWLFDDRPQEAVAEAAALADHQKQTATAVVILLVELEVLVQVVDALGQQSDLNLRGTGVTFVTGISLDDFGLFHGRFASLTGRGISRASGNRRCHSLPLAFSKLRQRFFRAFTRRFDYSTRIPVCK